MAFLTCSYMSKCIYKTIQFQAVIPMGSGQDILNLRQDSYIISKKFKTLYLLHGIMGNQEVWIQKSRILELAEKYQIAVIMPDGGTSFYVDNSEMECYGELIGRELIQATRSLFPLSDKREDTYIAGLSMGGYGAFRNGLKYSDVFSHAAALSPALIYYDLASAREEGIPHMKRSYYERVFGNLNEIMESDKSLEYLVEHCPDPPRLYMAIGTEDTLYPLNQRFRKYMQGNKVDFTYEEETGNHDFDFWGKYIEKVLKWIQM